jgi:hypothetical protein
MFAKNGFDRVVHVGGTRPGYGHPAHFIERLGDDPAGLAHQVDLARALELDYRR